MEGLDVRTLAFTNVYMGALLGFGLIAFSKVHSHNQAFVRLGIGHLLIAAGFLMIGLRYVIADFISIVIANCVLVVGVSMVGDAILRFFNVRSKMYTKLNASLIILTLISFYYLTYIAESTNMRIILLSFILAIQTIFIAIRMFIKVKETSNIFNRIIAYSFLIVGIIFALRAWLTLSDTPLDDFMDAGFIHGASIVVFQLIVVETSFLTSWSASLNLEKSLELKAMIDPLTQLYNRRALEELAKKEMSSSARNQQAYAVILVDLDHFKEVNDNFGHQAGDDVLVSIAGRLKSNIRNNDILARYGGEEFLIFLPATSGTEAVTLANKLKTIISSKPVEFAQPPNSISLTASFGVTANEGENADWLKVIADADKALYQAKNNGRNQVQSNFGYIHLVQPAKVGLEPI